MKKSEVFGAPILDCAEKPAFFNFAPSASPRLWKVGDSHLHCHSGHPWGSPSKKSSPDFDKPAGNGGVFASVKCLLLVAGLLLLAVQRFVWRMVR
jgi:hypothetical protein